jgi:Arc/MetJ-type ribon-helix-helix transcriptional regulator
VGSRSRIFTLVLSTRRNLAEPGRLAVNRDNVAYAMYMQRGGVMAAQTVGFAVADDDRPLLDRLVDRYGHGNRSEFLRVAMRVMAAEERAERLRDLQARVHAQVGRVYTADEVTDLVRQVLRTRG